LKARNCKLYIVYYTKGNPLDGAQCIAF